MTEEEQKTNVRLENERDEMNPSWEAVEILMTMHCHKKDYQAMWEELKQSLILYDRDLLPTQYIKAREDIIHEMFEIEQRASKEEHR